MSQAFRAIVLFLLVYCCFAACHEKKEPAKQAQELATAKPLKKSFKPLTDVNFPTMPGIEFHALQGVTEAKPVIVYLAALADCRKTRQFFLKSAHLICASSAAPPLIRQALQVFKKSLGKYLASAPIALIVDNSTYYASALSLTHEDASFFAHVFLLNSARYQLNPTLLETLSEAGLMQLALHEDAKNAQHLKVLAARKGLRLDLLTSRGQEPKQLNPQQEVLRLLVESDPRYAVSKVSVSDE